MTATDRQIVRALSRAAAAGDIAAVARLRRALERRYLCMETIDAMRARLVELSVAIRREQLRAGYVPTEHTPESQRLQELYERLQPAYARALDSRERAS